MNSYSESRLIRAIFAHLLHLPFIVLIAIATKEMVELLGAVWVCLILLSLMKLTDLISFVFYPKYEVLWETHASNAFITGMFCSLMLILPNPSSLNVIEQAILTWYLVYIWKCWKYKNL